jgi:hypothetical protein
VRRLVGELSHSHPGAKLKELDPPKRLDEQIHKLVIGVDVARLKTSFLQAASDEIIPHPDVFAPFMKNGVLYQGQSGLAVHPEFHRLSISAEEITKQSNKSERLSRSGGGCYVLGLAARQGHHHDTLGVGGMLKRDPGVTVVHLDCQIEGEKPQVTHLEMFRLQNRTALISDVRNRTLTLIEREDDTRS